MTEFKVIIGRAGTGKTEYAKRVAKKCIRENKTVYCLSFTHSAVNNMKSRNFPPECKFSTLHSFFRISPAGTILGCYRKVDVLIIDEFSLIDGEMLVKCVHSLKKLNNFVTIYLFGDILQLGTIRQSELIEYSSLQELLSVIPYQNLQPASLVKIIKHVQGLCINNPFIMKNIVKSITLTENHRSNELVSTMVDFIVFKDDKTLVRDNIIDINQVLKNIRSGWTFIASSYSILSKINSRLKTRDSINFFNWYLEPDSTVYSTVNTDRIYNGEHLTFKEFSNGLLILEKTDGERFAISEFPSDKVPIVLPSNIYTFHKSQGLEFDNVIVCIDDLFEFPMLYTGITRARNSVKFFSFNASTDNNSDLQTGSSVLWTAGCTGCPCTCEDLQTGSHEIAVLSEMYKEGVKITP